MKAVLYSGLIALSLLLWSACSGPSDPALKVGLEGRGIEISNARLHPPLPGRNVGVGYFDVTNYGTADRLIGVSSPVSPNIEIHTHIAQDGMMKMRRVDGVDLAQGATIQFQPGHEHLMFFDIKIPDHQDDVAVTLIYKNAAPMTMIVPIEGRGNEGEKRENAERSNTHSGH